MDYFSRADLELPGFGRIARKSRLRAARLTFRRRCFDFPPICTHKLFLKIKNNLYTLFFIHCDDVAQAESR
jgi:hypothetical protein